MVRSGGACPFIVQSRTATHRSGFTGMLIVPLHLASKVVGVPDQVQRDHGQMIAVDVEADRKGPIGIDLQLQGRLAPTAAGVTSVA